MYVVVMPGSTDDAFGGDPVEVLREVQSRLGRPGTYAGVIGNRFRAGATGGILPRGEAGRLATAAFEAHSGEGVQAVLRDFIDRVGAVRRGEAGGSDDDGGASGASGLVLLGLLAVGGGAWALNRRRHRRSEMEEVKRLARDDLVELGDEIRALDMDASMPDANPDAKQHYNAAVETYTEAEAAFDRARRPEDLAPVSAELERGRYDMQAARAQFEGKDAPVRRAPCFFDPRHGPSEREIEWAPPGGTPRPVPACAMDAQRVQEGLDPRVREIEYAGRQIPYWAAPAPFTPWFGGYWGGFGGFGGFLPGLLIGEMLGGGWGGGYEGGVGVGNEGDWGSGGIDLGDFGGGGGDFGGGDFGGGGDF